MGGGSKLTLAPFLGAVYVTMCIPEICTNRSKPALIDSDSASHGLLNARTIPRRPWYRCSREFSVFRMNIFERQFEFWRALELFFEELQTHSIIL